MTPCVGSPARRCPAADLLAPAEEITADETTCAAVLALRFELAALYLGLAAGTTGRNHDVRCRPRPTGVRA